jgi:hypothetical protein
LAPQIPPLGLLGDPLFQPGTLVGDRYRIDSVLGRGGFGDVYRAVHIGTHEPVALKVLRPELLAEGTAAERFAHEARMSASLRHPNTVRVFDFGRTPEGALYLAMEFLDGESLETLVQREAPLLPSRAVRLVVQVLRSLSEAHAKHIVHRDLKPDNIFVGTLAGEADFVRVIDFGIAKLIAEGANPGVTQIGAILGTPHYMSPEQIRGETLDARADLYSVGVVLYRCLSGRHPFHGDSTFAILAAHLQDDLPPLHEAGVDVGLQQIVRRALARDRSDRFASAEVFRQALETWQAATPQVDDRTQVADVIVVPDPERVPATAVAASVALPVRDPEATRVDDVVVAPQAPPTSLAEAGPSTAVIADAAEQLRAAMAARPLAADSQRPRPPPPRAGAARPQPAARPSPRPAGVALASSTGPNRGAPFGATATAPPGAAAAARAATTGDVATVAMDVLSPGVLAGGGAQAAETRSTAFPVRPVAAPPLPSVRRRGWVGGAVVAIALVAGALAVVWQARTPSAAPPASSGAAVVVARGTPSTGQSSPAVPPAVQPRAASVPAAPVAAAAGAAPLAAATALPAAGTIAPPAEASAVAAADSSRGSAPVAAVQLPTPKPPPAAAHATAARPAVPRPAVDAKPEPPARRDEADASAAARGPAATDKVPAVTKTVTVVEGKGSKSVKGNCAASEGSKEWCTSCAAAKDLSSSSRWYCPCLEARGQTSGMGYYCKCEFPKQDHKIGSPAFCRCNPRDPTCQTE